MISGSSGSGGMGPLAGMRKEASMPVRKGKEGMRDCMREFKEGTLHSGKGGPVVQDRRQAVAICMRASGQPPKRGKK